MSEVLSSLDGANLALIDGLKQRIDEEHRQAIDRVMGEVPSGPSSKPAQQQRLVQQAKEHGLPPDLLMSVDNLIRLTTKQDEADRSVAPKTDIVMSADEIAEGTSTVLVDTVLDFSSMATLFAKGGLDVIVDFDPETSDDLYPELPRLANSPSQLLSETVRPEAYALGSFATSSVLEQVSGSPKVWVASALNASATAIDVRTDFADRVAILPTSTDTPEDIATAEYIYQVIHGENPSKSQLQQAVIGSLSAYHKQRPRQRGFSWDQFIVDVTLASQVDRYNFPMVALPIDEGAMIWPVGA